MKASTVGSLRGCGQACLIPGLGCILRYQEPGKSTGSSQKNHCLWTWPSCLPRVELDSNFEMAWIAVDWI